MGDPASLTAAEILAIPADQPERLFDTPESVAGQYRDLAKLWHPDRAAGEDAEQVFRHLSILRTRAQEKIEEGTWQVPGVLALRGTDSVLRRVRYHRDFDVGVGRAYLGRTLVTYVINAGFVELARNGCTIIEALTFSDDTMQTAMAPRLPHMRAGFATADSHVVVIEKAAGMVRLQDLIDHLDGRLDPQHVAWIIGELLDIACYFEWAGLAHGDISRDSVFVNPADHTAGLLGGWWFAVRVGDTIKALPDRTMAVAPRSARNAWRASPRTDLELIRLLGRELLGDGTGTGLGANKAVPPALANWLRNPAPATPREDYEGWQSVLRDSFDARPVIALAISASDVYGEESQ